MKRLTSFIAFLVGGVGAALWLSQSFVNIWEPEVRAELERRLSDASHLRVQINTVSMPFFHRLRLSTVQAWTRDAHPHLVLRADDITLTLSLIDLPRAIWRRQPLQSIGLIHIQSPWLQYSADLLRHFPKGSSSPSALPLWFTFAWDNGTFQVLDSEAPTGAWSIYHAQGTVRLRGPKIDVETKGSLDQAQQIRVEFSSLRHRWNARVAVTGGDIHGVVQVLAQRFKRPLLPEGWQANGIFNLELLGGGRRFPSRGDPILSYLERGRLTFQKGTHVSKPELPPVGFVGSLDIDGGRVSADGLKVALGNESVALNGYFSPQHPDRPVSAGLTAPNLDLSSLASTFGYPGVCSGRADLRVSAGGTVLNPSISVVIKSTTLSLGRWSLPDSEIDAVYSKGAWNFDGSHLRGKDGTISLRGQSTPEANDVSLILENMPLAALSSAPENTFARGLFHAVLHLTGPRNEPDLSGSFGVNAFQWGDHEDPTTLRGRLEWADHHGQLSATSDDDEFRLSAEGSQMDHALSVDHFSWHMPDGSLLTGSGFKKPDGHVSASIDADHLALAGGLVPLRRWVPGLKGSASGKGKLSGIWPNVVFKGYYESNELLAGGDTLGHGQTSLEWSRGHLSLPTFRLSSGVEGGWTWTGPADWNVRLAVQQAPTAPLLKLVAPHGLLPGQLSGQVTIDRRGLKWTSGSFEGPWASLQASGDALWLMNPKDEHLEGVRFKGEGTAHSPSSSRVTWHFPFHLQGGWKPAPDDVGEANIRTQNVFVQGQSRDPLQVHLMWTRNTFSWSHTSWGPLWASDGKLHWAPASPVDVTAGVHFQDVPVSALAVFSDIVKTNDAQGLLNGAFTVHGPMNAMTEHLDIAFDQARWRRFGFHGTLSGDWNTRERSSVQASGVLDQGGQFAFEGAYEAKTDQIQGGVKLLRLNLEPLGESLSLPQSLEGTAAGLLTVSGTLKAPRFAGRLQGGRTVYGAHSTRPLIFDNYSMTVELAPSPENSRATRITFSDALVKTPEELVRFGAGSYIDYAPDSVSRLQISSELRNVHLGVFTLFGGLTLDGTWQIKPKGFAIAADASTRSLFINDYELEEGHINADYYDGLLRFSPPSKGRSLVTGTVDLHQSPQLHFSDLSVAGKEGQGIRLNGDLGPRLWNFQMEGHGLDIGTLAGLASFPYPLSGTAKVSLKGTGDFAHPHLDGNIDLEEGQALGLSYKTGSAAFLWQNNRITFTQLSLAYPGRFRLLGGGGFPVDTTQAGGDRSIDFSVRLQDSNLGFLQSLSSEVKKAKGPVQGLLQVTGTVDHPQLRGSLRITDGDVVGAHYIKHLKNLLASVDFTGDQLIIRELQGDAEAGGTFLASGSVTMKGLVPSAYDLRADITSSEGLAVQIPELAIPESPLSAKLKFLTSTSQAVVKGHFSFKGPAEAPQFKADAQISQGHFTFPPSHKNPPPASVMEWFRRINWDVNLKFGDGAWFDNELIQAAVLGALRIQGTNDKLRVDGGLDVTNGEISYLGLQFDIREARFDMRSDASGDTVENTPYMRGIADSTVQAVDTLNNATPDASNRQSVNDTITLTIDYAPIDQIKPRLTSAANPDLSPEKVLERATQMDVEDLTPQERNLVYQQQMVQIIDTSLARPLAKNILRRTGLVDNIRVQRVQDPSAAQAIDPATGQVTSQTQSSTSLFANTKYTFEKDLSDRVSLGYGIRFVPTTSATAAAVNATDAQNKLDLVSDVQLSYRWFRNVYVRGDLDLPNSDPNIIPDRRVTIEPRWRFGWWGNTNKEKIKPSQNPRWSTPSTSLVTSTAPVSSSAFLSSATVTSPATRTP